MKKISIKRKINIKRMLLSTSLLIVAIANIFFNSLDKHVLINVLLYIIAFFIQASILGYETGFKDFNTFTYYIIFLTYILSRKTIGYELLYSGITPFIVIWLGLIAGFTVYIETN